MQNKAYDLGSRLLRPDGWLQIADRSVRVATSEIAGEIIESHRQQAETTSMQVFDMSHMPYTEPKCPPGGWIGIEIRWLST